MASATDLLPARYARPTPIASGGMGRVYRATDLELGRDVAVKVLADRYADDSAVRARFQREAMAAARLSGHPNIVTIFDIAEWHGRPMIVMEYLEGGSLEARIQGHGGCPPAQVLDWLEQTAGAIDAAHAAGVVHRDLKPGNLLLDGKDQVHVGDFGIASAAGLDSSTETGTVLGTAGYLSPEQARGERATAASDRYGLAVVAFELLAGKRPFEASSTRAEAIGHATAPVPSVHATKADVPAALDPVFARALAKDPGDRYPSAVEFVAALRQALAEDAGETAWIVPAAPVPVPTAITRENAAAAAPTPTPRPVARPRETRRAWLVPLLLVALLAAGALAAYAATRASSPRHAASRKPVTVVRTVTTPGRTVEQTVTATPSPPETSSSSPPPATQPVAGSSSGVELNDAGYAKMQAGDYAGALPLFEQAVQKLSGTDGLAEAYADYNLAFTRYALGQCTGVLALLDRSQAIQGRRTEIDSLRRSAGRACG